MSDPTVTIKGRTWTLGAVLGSGGHGEVREAESGAEIAAVKFIPKISQANRDLLFADDLRGAVNVLPVLDHDETETHLTLLMPRADMSLRQYLTEQGRILSEADALPILTDITRALVSLEPKGIIHRDLKPDNILLHQGSWCLADFGVSRYIDATSATFTWNQHTTRPYMAPEQWRGIRATSAADVYALGIISYELLRGSLPFLGPDIPDFQQQHLYEYPVLLTATTRRLAALIEQCLYKEPGARPAVQAILSYLEQHNVAASLASWGLAKLQAANYEVVRRVAREVREQSAAQVEEERREGLLKIARRQFTQIGAEVEAAIQAAAPAAKRDLFGMSESGYMSGWHLDLHSGAIAMLADWTAKRRPDLPFGYITPTQPSVGLPFDVIACGSIAVNSCRTGERDRRRAHSLWFCDAHEEGKYGWYEVAFAGEWSSYDDEPIDYFRIHGSPGSPYGGFGIYLTTAEHASSRKGAIALEMTSRKYFVAWPFTLLEVGDLGEFIDRWASWLAGATQGSLPAPSSSPEAIDLRSWRTSDRPYVPSSPVTPLLALPSPSLDIDHSPAGKPEGQRSLKLPNRIRIGRLSFYFKDPDK